MKRLDLSVEAHTRVPRLEAIPRCEQLVNATGLVEDFHLFGKSAIHFIIAVPAGQLSPLLSQLQAQDFLYIDRVSDPFMLLEKGDAEKEIILNLNLTFYKPLGED